MSQIKGNELFQLQIKSFCITFYYEWTGELHKTRALDMIKPCVPESPIKFCI